MDHILGFVLGFFQLINFGLAFLGIALFTVGHQFSKYIYPILTLIFGFTLGYLIGIMVESTLISWIIGVCLGSTLAFFNFAYHKYLHGIILAALTLVLSFYLFFSLLGLSSFGLWVLVICVLLAVVSAVLGYRYPRITTVIVTAWLGAIFILHNLMTFIFTVPFSWFTLLISFLLGLIGFCVQIFLISRYRK